jgi:hypothetical protein
MDSAELTKQIVDMNIGKYGAAAYSDTMIASVRSLIERKDMEGLIGATHILRELKRREGAKVSEITSAQTGILETLRSLLPSPRVAPAAGRRMTRKYCKKTPCKKMGFTQKASCRPWKNCYLLRKTRRAVA